MGGVHPVGNLHTVLPTHGIFIILYIMIVFMKYFLFYQFSLLNYNILYYVATENKVTPIKATHSCRSFVFLVPFVFKTICGNP